MTSRKGKKKGFHTPFHELKKTVAKPPPAKKSLPKKPTPVEEHTDDNDESLFARMAGNATPINDKRGRVAPAKHHEPRVFDDDESVREELESLVNGNAPFRIEDSGIEVWGAVDGVNRSTLQQLRRGQLAWRKHLDLHGFTREEAHARLATFIADSRRNNERCVLVVTGRGKGSPGGVSVLREAMPRWLGRAPIRPHVLAFCTAQPADGGLGAFYVLLRRAGAKPFGISL